ncbi:uncharacterized protein DUF4433 [Actinophytocola oryzae]|uniref:Uncharacterized protein DUF4433 n=2 Tax=Actinophytocola oryzae TaxID=502181 RepID=A0A4R7UXH6_9PSEU|nr:DUF4433 domain-containing protein [Actinophytocola oryzae]TDV40742.1 uncharacterized protein DUF4433 [Actinophytocola oryzae]
MPHAGPHSDLTAECRTHLSCCLDRRSGGTRLRYIQASSFAGRGQELPRQDNPRDWLVWHVTHVENLVDIASTGALVARSTPRVSIALKSVNGRRPHIPVAPDDSYPANRVVSDHVPFYFAAKSPMLLRVKSGHVDYQGGDDPLVFVGLAVGDAVDSSMTWCVSDQNAAVDIVEFTRELDQIGTFIDFPLMRQKMWNNTPQDPNRQSRPAAEFIILDKLPLNYISHVVTKNSTTMARVKQILSDVDGISYIVDRNFYY